jgi:hypothetical protein
VSPEDQQLSSTAPKDRPAVWTPLLARALVTSVVMVVLAGILVPLSNPVAEGVGVGLLFMGVLVFIVVDTAVVRRASPGVNPLFRMFDAFSIRRKAYRWSCIRAALTRQ